MGGHDMRPSSSPSSGDIADGLATNLGEGHYTRFPRETPERVLSAPAATTRARQPFDIERQISGDSQHLSKSQRSTGSGHRVLSKTSSFLRDLLSKRSSEKQERSDGAGAAAEAGASFSTGRTTYTIHPRPYKGFSTPFCGLFATSGGLPTVDHAHPQLYGRGHAARELRLSHQRTDLCALSPCCGILQADHTRYLLTHIRPPSLAKRMCLHVGIPCGLFLLAGYCAGHIRDSYANSVVCTALVYCLVVWIVSACTHARKKRVMVREEILWRLQRREARVRARLEEQVRGGDGPLAAAAESEEYEYYSEDEEEYKKRDYGAALGQTRCEMNCAHRLVGCYPSDLPPPSCCSDGSEVAADGSYMRQHDETTTPEGKDASADDLCTRLWSCFAKPCLPCVPLCGGGHGCHLQCCGLCALAQEAREANLTLPRHLRMVDYITMEPFLSYYPRIAELRMRAAAAGGDRSRHGSFLDHCQAISGLSRLLLVSCKVILVALLLVSLSSAVGYWDLSDMAVLTTTFLQSFAVMYCVHWGWHRHDLSLDAVIKYFACGFVLSTGMAFALELAEYLTFQAVVVGIVWWMEVQEVQDDGYGGGRYLAWRLAAAFSDDGAGSDSAGRRLGAGKDILQGFLQRHPAAKIFYIFLSSYLMAGLVEEICKYFGFVMVDHPDFCSVRELDQAKATMPLQLLRDREEDDDDVSAEPREDNKASPVAPVMPVDEALARFDPMMQRRSFGSIRAGVTVAMVAVALGFACCENILQIFIYNRSSLRSEITTLIVKSLFPVHPIAAAIQSVYVCRRDLEKDPSISLGRIVLPSLVFHGTYDFTLMMITSSWQRSNKEQYFNQSGNVTGVAMASFAASLCIVLAGGLYYRISSRAQYARLQHEPGTGSGPLSEASFGLLL